jgi:glycosyltransferase involved in cell wall biosynthesis
MRILLVTMQYGPGYGQGTERYLSSLGRSLRERGHEVSVLAGDPLRLHTPKRLGEPREFRGDGDLPVYAFPSRGWMSVVGLGPERVRPWLQEHRPDVVHVANPAHVGIGILQACRQLGLPTAVTIMDFWWACPKGTLMLTGPDALDCEYPAAACSICDGNAGWRECTRCMVAGHPRRGVRWLGKLPVVLSPATAALYVGRGLLRGMAPAEVLRWMNRREILLAELNRVGAVIFPSRAVQDVVGSGLRHARTRLGPYGLTPEWFEAPRVQRTQALDPERFTIGYAGAMLPHKGPHLLLQAVRKLGWTRTRVRMAGPLGSDDYAGLMRQLAQGLQVEFAGQVSADRMPAFLRSVDVMAMTSLWPENLPFVVLESHAAGVPVVGSKVGGVTEQIGTGPVSFEPGSATELAAALEFVRTRPAEVALKPVRTVAEMATETESAYAAAIRAATEPTQA